MKIFRIVSTFGGFLCLALSLRAQTFTTLHSFDGPGQDPVAPLVQGVDGNFYGTTSGILGNSSGTVFNITPSGTLSELHVFGGGADGWNPLAGLVQATNGKLYGTTSGIVISCALLPPCFQNTTIFDITTAGQLTTLDSVEIYGGGGFEAGLTQAINGKFYGTNTDFPHGGSIFEMTAGGALTILYSFCLQSNCIDGAAPVASLIQATDGNLYGTTSAGGSNNGGTVFKIATNGSLTTLYSFCSQGGSDCTDGTDPVAALVQANDGNLYGTTYSGGANNAGTVFSITTAGAMTTLYSFCSQPNCSDGNAPKAGLIQATDGSLYGTTSSGGNGLNNISSGTLFRIKMDGTLTTLYDFCSQSDCADGANPSAGLVQGTDGTFYGTTTSGGLVECLPIHSHGFAPCGTIFSFSEGLYPFVKTLPAAGKVGAVVDILGTNLSGVNYVTFNGTSAEFKVVSSSLVEAEVPAGATTGEVVVHFHPSHDVYSSNVPFYVLQ